MLRQREMSRRGHTEPTTSLPSLSTLALGTTLLCALALPHRLSAQESLLVSGRLLDAAGQPAAATVHLMPSPPSHARRLHDLGSAEMESLVSVQPGSDGRFEAEVPPGIYRLDAVTSQGLRLRMDLGVLVDDLSLTDVTVPRAAELGVRVTDEDGSPIEDALVLVDTQQWVRPPGDSEREQPGVGLGRWHGRTDQNGRVAAPSLPGANHPVRVAAPGFLARGVPSNARGVVTVALERGAPQPLQVTDERGRPVPRAVVRFGESLVPVALTDDDGKATVTASLEQALDYQVESADLGYGGVTVPPGGREQALRVALDPPAVLFGKVIDRTTGDPLPGALVWSRNRPSDFATTGPEGRYELPTWTASNGVHLSVAAQSYGSERSHVWNVDSEAPTVALEPNRAITLLIRDERGEKVASAFVTVRPRDRRNMLREPKPVQSNDEGQLALRGLRSGTYSLYVEHPDYASTEATVTIDVARQEPVQVTLADGIVGWGTVLDSDDQPLAGVEVWLQPESTQARQRIGFYPHPPRKTVTDAEGRFDLAPVVPGRYDLHAEADGFAPGKVNGFELEFDEQEIGTLTLEPSARFSGRMIDEDGEPVSGVMLYLREAEFRRGQPPALQTARSADDGTFAIDRLGRGEFILNVQAQGFVEIESREISLPLDEPLEIRLERGLAIRGTVRGADGEGVTSYLSLFWVDRSDGYPVTRQVSSLTTEADGRFEIGPATRGSHVLMVAAAEHVQRSVEIDIGDEAPSPLDISLDRGAVLSGTVTADGRAVGGARISAHRSGLDDTSIEKMFGIGAEARSDGEGRYRLAGVPGGKVTITASADGYQSRLEELDIAGDRRLDLELTRGLRITGRVIDESGDPVEGAYVDAMVSQDRSSWGGGQHRGFSDASGAFEIGGLEPGWAQLEVAKDGYATPNVPEIELRQSPPELEIVLERGFTVSGRVVGLEPEELTQVRLNLFASAVRTYSGGNYREAALDYQGGFSVPNVSRGKWRLSASLQESGRVVGRALDVERDLDGIELDFGGGLILRGTVTVDGQPTAARISANSLDGSSSASQTVDSSGIFELEGLQPGAVQINLSTSEPPLQHIQQVDLQTDLDLTIDLTTSALEVVVLGSDGAPVEGAPVALMSAIGAQSALGVTGPDGSLSARLEAEAYQQGGWIVVEHATLGSGRAQLNGQRAVEVRLAEQDVLLVSFSDETGARRASAVVWLQHGETVLARSSQAASSPAEIRAVPGSYLLWAIARDQVAGPLSVSVPGEVTAPLERGGWARMSSRSAALGGRVIARRGELRHPRTFYADATGSQPIGPLAPGPWTLEVVPLGGSEVTARVEVQILPGETVEVEVP